MKVYRANINSHKRTVVFHLYRLISGFSAEAILRTVAYVLPEAHTRVRGSSCAALHRGGGHAGRVTLPWRTAMERRPWYTSNRPPVCKSGGGPSEPPEPDL